MEGDRAAVGDGDCVVERVGYFGDDVSGLLDFQVAGVEDLRRREVLQLSGDLLRATGLGHHRVDADEPKDLADVNADLGELVGLQLRDYVAVAVIAGPGTAIDRAGAVEGADGVRRERVGGIAALAGNIEHEDVLLDRLVPFEDA